MPQEKVTFFYYAPPHPELVLNLGRGRRYHEHPHISNAKMSVNTAPVNVAVLLEFLAGRRLGRRWIIVVCPTVGLVVFGFNGKEGALAARILKTNDPVWHDVVRYNLAGLLVGVVGPPREDEGRRHRCVFRNFLGRNRPDTGIARTGDEVGYKVDNHHRMIPLVI